MKKGSKNFVQQNDAETEIEKLPETETIIVSDEDDDMGRWLDQLPETESEVEGTDKPLLEVKTDKAAENGTSIKYRLTSLKRALENKTASLDREKAKVEDWLVQAKHRDEKSLEEFEKRKTELEALLTKNEERYNKRKAKTQKYWWDYCINYSATKVKKIEEEVEQLKAEHEKLSASVESKEVAA
ncbi:MAG: hypothetical protein HYZ54_01990 [Ignavibacteriae bacterium]|nr:hypothetical protein [Ignavibacteriota bacterium]